MNALTLNDDARNTLSSALRVAAERYDEHFETLAKMSEEPNANKSLLSSLQAQFKLQAARSRSLASLVDECEIIELSSRSEIETVDVRFFMDAKWSTPRR